MFKEELLYINSKVDQLFTWKDVPDNTFEATMLALLYSRVDNPKIEFHKYTSPSSAGDVELNPETYTVNLYENTSFNPDINLQNLKEKYEIKSFSAQEAYIKKQLNMIYAYSGSLYIRAIPKFNTLCIFTTKMTLPMWHSIQILIPKAFPVFWDKPLTKQETNLLLSLTASKEGAVKYKLMLFDLTKTKEFDRLILVRSLPGIEKKLFQGRINRYERQIESLNRSMEKALKEYQTYCESKNELVNEIFGLQTMQKNKAEHTEIEDYILNNKNICNFSVNDEVISFIVQTYLVPYNQSEWDILRANRSFFEGRSNKYSTEEVKMLLDALFSRNRKLKLKMCGLIKIDYFGTSIHSVKTYDYKADGICDYIPNPHLNIHDCFGQNSAVILEQMKYGDLVGAIECAIQTVQKVNFHESYTFNPFVKQLFQFEGECIVAGDKEMTVRDAIEYLKGQKNE